MTLFQDIISLRALILIELLGCHCFWQFWIKTLCCFNFCCCGFLAVLDKKCVISIFCCCFSPPLWLMPVFAPAGAGAEPVVVPPSDCRRQSHLLPASLARLQHLKFFTSVSISWNLFIFYSIILCVWSKHLDKLLKVAAGVLDWDVVERHPSDSDSPFLRRKTAAPLFFNGDYCCY